MDPEVVRSHIQKLRSFRYQMKSTLAGDNLDTMDELAQKGILSNGELSMSLEHQRNGSISLARYFADCEIIVPCVLEDWRDGISLVGGVWLRCACGAGAGLTDVWL